MAAPRDDRAEKSTRGKARSPAERPAGDKVKATFHLSREASQRLDIHCTMANLDRSAMVEGLIRDHLRRWVVSDRGGAPAPPVRIADEPAEDDRRETA